ncbi:glycosyl hydrolase [Phaeosphaeriaceae sp. PMI808]|nr:glycosyl hydrolase [Phaeosphaeriaceae sp. PMI808]
MFFSISSVFCLLSFASAQSDSAIRSSSARTLIGTTRTASGPETRTATSTYSQSDVPTGTAISGKYDSAYRPQVHFSPPQGFMNDPNGMFVDDNGTYHLYYQYNPVANVAGRQHWGHATSKDLYTWTNQPIAIFPGGPTEGVFSGSAVVDVNNTSGFFPNQTNGVVAIYTINVPENQTQQIAYSYDNGYSFTKYANNPVLVPGGTNSNQYRDPKVIWYEATKRWVMVVAYPIDFKIGIFSSPNLIDWTPESNFSNHGLTGLQYECPNLVEIRVEGNSSTAQDESMYAMFISINPGAPLGGSITEYFLGKFNGTHFNALDSTVRLTDFSKDNYAGQFFYGIPTSKDQITLNWASNWQYTNEVPTAGEKLGDGFRSAMTVPRGHYLKELPRYGLSLISYPWNIMSIVDSELASNKSLGNSTIQLDYSHVKSGAIYFEANITGLTTAEALGGSIDFKFSSSASGENVSGGTFPGGDVWLDRGHTNGFENPFFSDKFSATGLYNEKEASWRLSGIIDRSIIEIFLNGGELSASSVFFPSRPLDTMTLKVSGLKSIATASVGVWALKAAWLDQADVSGTVYGNVTKSGSAAIGSMKLM